MRRLVSIVLPLALVLPLASCVHSPSEPVAAPARIPGPGPVTGAAGGAGSAGGILLWSDQVAEWCTCAPPPDLARVREGVGLRFFWSAVDPVAADRFAEFRFSVNGIPVEDWGSWRGWPEADEGEPPTYWFPSAGTHVFRVDKLLGGEITSLEAEFEVVGP